MQQTEAIKSTKFRSTIDFLLKKTKERHLEIAHGQSYVSLFSKTGIVSFYHVDFFLTCKQYLASFSAIFFCKRKQFSGDRYKPT